MMRDSRQEVQHMWLHNSVGGQLAPPTGDMAATPVMARNWSRSSANQQLQQEWQQHSQLSVPAVPADAMSMKSSISVHQAAPFTHDAVRRTGSLPLSAIGSGVLSVQAPMCPDLLVPEGTECCLLLAEMGEGGSALSGVLPIHSGHGGVVLWCAYTLAESPPQDRYDLPGNGMRLVLRNAKDEEMLASSRDIVEPDAGSAKGCSLAGTALLDAAGEQHAVLRPNRRGPRSGYMLTHRSGRRILIRKDTSAGFCVTDEDGWLLASTSLEDAGARAQRCLRIHQGADAGAVILAMLSAEVLEVHSHRQPLPLGSRGSL